MVGKRRLCQGIIRAILCCICLSACSASTPSAVQTASSSSTGEASSSETSGGGDSPVAARLEKAMREAADDDEMVSSMGPFSSISVHDDVSTVEPIVNASETTMDAGRYTLTTYCVGTGALSIEFSIGKSSGTSELVCGDDLRSDLITIDAERSSGSRIVVEPSANAVCEIAYVVRRLQ